eukprot:g48409.t1
MKLKPSRPDGSLRGNEPLENVPAELVLTATVEAPHDVASPPAAASRPPPNRPPPAARGHPPGACHPPAARGPPSQYFHPPATQNQSPPGLSRARVRVLHRGPSVSGPSLAYLLHLHARHPVRLHAGREYHLPLLQQSYANRRQPSTLGNCITVLLLQLSTGDVPTASCNSRHRQTLNTKINIGAESALSLSVPLRGQGSWVKGGVVVVESCPPPPDNTSSQCY